MEWQQMDTRGEGERMNADTGRIYEGAEAVAEAEARGERLIHMSKPIYDAVFNNRSPRQTRNAKKRAARRLYEMFPYRERQSV
jgi:hypothetical protein